MRNTFIFVLIIIMIFVFLHNTESFDVTSYINSNNCSNQTYISSEPSPSQYLTELDMTYKPNVNCCIVQKKYLPDDTNMFGGNFKYTFEKATNESCDPRLYMLDSNKQLFVDGQNDWSNDYCSADNTNIGSCRNINRECIDFVDKKFCDKYNMVWSNKTCHQQLDFVWVDKIKRDLPPKSEDSGIVQMF